MNAFTVVAIHNTGLWVFCAGLLFAAYKMPECRGGLIFAMVLIALFGGMGAKHTPDVCPKCGYVIRDEHPKSEG